MAELIQRRSLPNSGGRYEVSADGKVYSQGMELKQISAEDGIRVNLIWTHGQADYCVGALVVITFLNHNIHSDHWNKIIPLHKDGDRGNNRLSNLIYRFSEPIPTDKDWLEGFFVIPMYSMYAINLKGETVNINSYALKTYYATKPKEEKNITGGYLFSRVIDDFGKSSCLSMHRALCYVFKEYDGGVLGLVVNHIDGKPSNNDVSNLELVTRKENNLHAIEAGLKVSMQAVLVKNLVTQEITRFASISECSRFFGRTNNSLVWYRIRSAKVTPDMLVVKLDDGEPWPEYDTEKVVRNATGRRVQAKNIFFDKVHDCENARVCADITGIGKETIIHKLNRGNQMPFYGWVFKEDGEWPTFTVEQIEQARANSRLRKFADV